MKRLDEGKVSLVDFLRSIKFTRHETSAHCNEDHTQFADFSPRARRQKNSNAEECNLVRSAN